MFRAGIGMYARMSMVVNGGIEKLKFSENRKFEIL